MTVQEVGGRVVVQACRPGGHSDEAGVEAGDEIVGVSAVFGDEARDAARPLLWLCGVLEDDAASRPTLQKSSKTVLVSPISIDRRSGASRTRASTASRA